VPDGPTPVRPPQAGDGPFILCIGTNFRHKNRIFALDVLEALRTEEGWSGSLVFAGPHAAAGTSELEETQWLAVHPETAAFVTDLGEVSDAEKAWLLDEAKGVIYPSVYEGFGLVPFEAAASGTPCFYAWHTAMRETLPEHAATIEPWNARATAGRIGRVLADPAAATTLVDAVADSARTLTWDATATKVIDVYEQAVRRPSRTVVSLADDVGSAAALGARLEGRPLEALDLPEDTYRALRALMARPALRGTLYAALRAVYVVGHLVRNGRLPERIV
jgi:glycosyltransferase involved in cell wall biosynthesis